MTETEKSLVESLRRPVYVGGHDPDEIDPLHTQAANKIEELLAKVPKISDRVGMPASIWLDEFGSHVYSVFGTNPYLVGSALRGERKPNDIDVRLILSDEEYAAWGLGDPVYPQSNPRWVGLVLAFSALGKAMTGLPIDFQIQQQTRANEREKGPRSAVGITALRMSQIEASNEQSRTKSQYE